MRYTKTLFITVTVLTPSLFTPFLPEGFEFVKTYFIILALILGIILTGKQWNNRTIKTNTILLLFLFLNLVSTIFAIDFATSFFGYYDRFAGSFLFITAITLFLVNNSTLLKIKPAEIIRLILIGSIVPIIYGYLQLLELDQIQWATVDNRIFSTFGQPNLFANYLAVVSSCLLICFCENSNSHKYNTEQSKKGVYESLQHSRGAIGLLLSYSLVFILMLETKSISAFIAYGLTYLLYFIRLKNIDLKRYLVIGMVSIVLIMLFGSPFLSRLGQQALAFDENKTVITNDTGKIRLVLWENSLKQMFKGSLPFNGETLHHILIGVGPENFAYVFERPTELNSTSEWKMLFNKPHNFYIEELLELGVFGLLFYLFVTAIFILNIKKTPLSIIGLCILASSFFLWPSAYLYFLLFLIFYKVKGKYSFAHRIFNFQVAIFNKFTNLINFKIRNIILISGYLAILISSILYITSYVLVTTKPCISAKLIRYYQNFAFECGSKTRSEKNLIRAYKMNVFNKLIAEKVGNNLIVLNPKKSEKIFNELLKKEPENPVYNFYKGVIEENKGNYTNALKYYKKADDMVPNYFEAHEAVERINANLFE